MSEAREKAEAADRLRSEAVAANRQAARRLHTAGWSYRLIGKAMHLTHQRVEQLVNGTRELGPATEAGAMLETCG